MDYDGGVRRRRGGQPIAAFQLQFGFVSSVRLLVAPATDLIAGMDVRAFWHGCLPGTDARVPWQDALSDSVGIYKLVGVARSLGSDRRFGVSLSLCEER